jgi:hypothetical protein
MGTELMDQITEAEKAKQEAAGRKAYYNLCIKLGFITYFDNIDFSAASTRNTLISTGIGLTAFTRKGSLAASGQYITSKGLVRDINPLKLTRNSRPYAFGGKFLRGAGWAGFGAGVFLDAGAVMTNQISGMHFVVNSSIGLGAIGAGFMSGGAIPAFIGSTMYFAVDTYFPGGWPGAMDFNFNLQRQNQQILGNRFNLYKD